MNVIITTTQDRAGYTCWLIAGTGPNARDLVAENGFTGGELIHGCNRDTLSADDLVCPCILPAGHNGYCHTGR